MKSPGEFFQDERPHPRYPSWHLGCVSEVILYHSSLAKLVQIQRTAQLIHRFMSINKYNGGYLEPWGFPGGSVLKNLPAM